MSNALSVETLKARLMELDKERELLLQLIEIRSGGGLGVGESKPEVVFQSPVSQQKRSNTIRGRVVDATIELIHKLGRNVSNEEVLNFVEEKKISLGNTADKVRTIGAILSQECDKKSARIKRVTRGVYDIK